MFETASTDGVTCSYLPLGGSGPRLLFVHATGFCATVWRPFAAALADRFECWALDIRSHGASTDQDPSTELFSWSATGDDVVAVVDAIEAEHGPTPGGWRGIGHSMGGAALLMAEAQRPTTFASLWLYEPIVFPPALRDNRPGGVSNPLADGAERRRRTFDSAAAALANFASKPPMMTLHPDALAGYVERGFVPVDPAAPDGEVTLACDPTIESYIYRTGSQHHTYDLLAELRCPVTVAGGPTDDPGPGALAPLVAAAIPGGRHVRYDDLGHFAPVESPDRLAIDATHALLGESS